MAVVDDVEDVEAADDEDHEAAEDGDEVAEEVHGPAAEEVGEDDDDGEENSTI